MSEVDPVPGVAGRRMATVLGALVFAVFALTAAPAINTIDVESVDIGAWTLATTGHPWTDDVEPDQLPAKPKPSALWTTTNVRNGHQVMARSIGAMLVGVPAYAVAELVSPDPGKRLPIRPGGITAALLAAVALALLIRSLAGRVPGRVTMCAGLALAFTTPFWSIVGHDLWPHALTVLGIAGMAWSGRNRRWVACGAFGGIGLLGRLHFAFFVAVFGIVVACRQRDPRLAFRVAAGSLPFVGFSAVLSRLFYGSWNPNGGYQMGDLSGWAHTQSALDRLLSLAGVFVSPGVGIFVWTPALLLVLPAVVRSWRVLPAWSTALLAGAAVYLGVQLWLNPFSGGAGFWGYRISIELVVAAFPAVVLSWGEVGSRARAVLPPLVGAQAGVIALGAIAGLAIFDEDAWHTNVVLSAFRIAPVVVVGAVVGGVALAYCVRGLARQLPESQPQAHECDEGLGDTAGAGFGSHEGPR
jgi:alpha-1,2-mannosyltransferase